MYVGRPAGLVSGERVAKSWLTSACNSASPAWAGRRTAEHIFGAVDAMKLRSSLALFDRVEPDSLFAQALMNFFAGERDERTLALLDGGQ